MSATIRATFTVDDGKVGGGERIEVKFSAKVCMCTQASCDNGPSKISSELHAAIDRAIADAKRMS